MAYVVLARKWRSKHFDEVVGQGHVARTLQNSIDQDRVAHAYLFCGARGVGKTSTARILAKALNCHKGPTKTPCYECPSCLEISEGNALDVFEIDGASNRGINEIRELRESATYTPSRDRFKVYIIDEVHMLTTEAFNALLKTLEEPPPHVKFIFATTEPQKIPVTILSRCQRFDFKRINQSDIVDHLSMICNSEQIEAEEEGLQLIARQAAGGMRDALSLLDQVISFAGKMITSEQVTQVLGVANRSHLFEMSQAIVKSNPEAALLALDDVHRYGYDLNQFARELIQHLRDLTVVKVVKDPARVTSLTSSELSSISATMESTTVDMLHRMFSVMVEGAEQMSRSAYPKLLFEMTLVRLCALEPMLGIDLMIDKLKDLEELLEPGAEAKKKTEQQPVISTPSKPPASFEQVVQSIPVTQVPSAPPAPMAPPVLDIPEPGPTVAKEPEILATPEPSPEPSAMLESMPSIGVPGAPPAQMAPPPKKPTRDPNDIPPWEEQPVAPVEPQKEMNEPEQPTQPEVELAVEPKVKPPSNAPPWATPVIEPQAKEEPPAPEPEPELESEPEPEPPAKIPSFEFESTSAPMPARPTLDEDAEPVDLNKAPPLPQIDLEALGRQQAWHEVVGYLRSWAAPLAGSLDHAYVEEFSSTRLSLSFLPMFMNLMHNEYRLEPLHQTVKNLFGESFKVTMTTRHEEQAAPGFETIDQLRRAAREALEEKLALEINTHPLVQEVEMLFAPIKKRVFVALEE